MDLRGQSRRNQAAQFGELRRDFLEVAAMVVASAAAASAAASAAAESAAASARDAQ